jgi:thiamine-phosphate pyrophosphorylase
MTSKGIDFTLYLVTDRRWLGKRSLWVGVEEAIRGGVTIVQLREKDISSKEYLEIAKRVKEVTDRHGIPLIINDRTDIAFACDAAGVHLGPDDLPVPIARKILGRKKMIGASADSLEEALMLEAQGVDYLGVGAVFPTGTKTDAGRITLEELAGIKAAVTIPVVAIGGINAENAATAVKTGVDGVAVVSAVMAQREITAAAREIFDVITRARIQGGFEGLS